jgi:hypothetical protein
MRRRTKQARRPEGAARSLALALAGGRLAIGAGIWAAPDLAGRALGFGRLDPKARALARLAGTRDIALGALALVALEDVDRTRAIVATNAVVDAGDAVTFGLALTRGEGIGAAAGLGVLTAGVATVSGLILASKLG